MVWQLYLLANDDGKSVEQIIDASHLYKFCWVNLETKEVIDIYDAPIKVTPKRIKTQLFEEVNNCTKK